MLRTFTVAVLITLGGGLVAIAQTDVSGSWTLTITSDQGSNPSPLMLVQEGEMLMGTAGEAPVKGRDHAITLAATIEAGR